MKIKPLFTAMMAGFFLLETIGVAQTTTQAATQPTSPNITPSATHSKGNKGHFVFGTDLLGYSNGAYTIKGYSADKQTDTINETYNNLSFSLNIWAGYFVSDKVCVGLSFGNDGNSTNIYDYLLAGYPYDYFDYSPFSSLVPSNLFFRYYLHMGDSSARIDIYLEGIIGGAHSSGNYVFSSGTGTSASEAMQINQFNIDGDLNIVFSFQVSNRFSIPVKLGFLYNYYEMDYPSYVINGGSYPQTEPSGKVTISSPSFVGSIGVQYKL
ncbi:MAG: hypothetical protein ACLQQ4_08535 [Bacteroidia bacterium]